MASRCFKLPIRCVEKWKAGYQPLHDSSSNLRVEFFNNVSQLAIKIFYADKTLVKVNLFEQEMHFKDFCET